MRTTISFYLLISILTGSLWSQTGQVKFDRISSEEGLSQSVVLSILQDKQGFMWFGTQDGLNRFDGYRFTIYKNDPKDPESLSHNTVQVLSEDKAGTLWVGTSGGGLNRFDRERETFVRYKADPSNPASLSHNSVRAIYEDRQGTFWIGTEGGGLNEMDRQTGVFTRYFSDPDNPSSLSSNSVLCIYEDSLRRLWVGTSQGGLCQFDRQKKSFVRYISDLGDPYSLSDDTVFSILEDRRGSLWFATGGGLDQILPEQSQESPPRFTSYRYDRRNPSGLSGVSALTIVEDASGGLWIGTNGGGINRILPTHLKESPLPFIHYQYDQANPDSLSNNVVLCLYVDRSGLLWAGTSGGGINKVNREKERFSHYNSESLDPAGEDHAFILSVLEDRSGLLWIGTRRGLCRVDRQVDRHISPWPGSGLPEDLRRTGINSLFQDSSEAVWIGTAGSGLYRWNPSDNRFRQYRSSPSDPRSLSQDHVSVISGDQKGNIWIGTLNGLNQWNPAAGNFTRFLADPKNPESLSDDRIVSLFTDREGVLWVGTYGGGLNRLVPGRKAGEPATFRRYEQNVSDPYSLSTNHVLSIYESRAGQVWVGTYGGGLNQFDRKTESFSCYLEKDGLPNNTVYGILEDEAGHLWLSTNNGLSEFNPELKTFRNYTVRDGLQGNEFNPQSYFKGRNGEMFFGGINGLNIFHPDIMTFNMHVPPLAITDIQIAGTPLGGESGPSFKKSLFEFGEIRLSYRQTVLSIEFAALDFNNPGRNQYAYKMEGLNREWVGLGTQRRVNFSGLSPGEYLFRVKGSNNDGLWNEEGISLRIRIRPPFWRTGWFIVLLAGLGAGLIAAAWRLRSRYRALQFQEDFDLASLIEKFELTKREEEIVRRIVKGKSNEEIEKELFISLSTVKNHIYNIYQKLGVKNRLQLLDVLRAQRAGRKDKPTDQFSP